MTHHTFTAGTVFAAYTENPDMQCEELELTAPATVELLGHIPGTGRVYTFTSSEYPGVELWTVAHQPERAFLGEY